MNPLDPIFRQARQDQERLDVLDRRRFGTSASGITEHEPDPPSGDGGGFEWAAVRRVLSEGELALNHASGTAIQSFDDGWSSGGSLVPSTNGITAPEGLYWVQTSIVVEVLPDESSVRVGLDGMGAVFDSWSVGDEDTSQNIGSHAQSLVILTEEDLLFPRATFVRFGVGGSIDLLYAQMFVMTLSGAQVF